MKKKTPRPTVKINPRYFLSLLITAAVLVANLFWLPTTSWWSLYATDNIIGQKYDELLAYRHPPIAYLKTGYRQPVLESQSYIIIDPETNQVLISKNPDQKIYPASITKLASALTALNIYPLEEVLTVGSTYAEGKVMELLPGEKITVRSLVDALLVYSANDAAYNLANHHGQGEAGFIKQMNLLAEKYGIKNTHFTNYDGIHHPDHYSTVYDLAQLGRISIQNPIIKDVVKKKSMVITDVSGNHQHFITTTNELLGVVTEIEGLKTGWTPEAGGCFIGLVNLNGRYLITVVAQSQDRFADTKALIEWSKQNVLWKSYSP